MNAVDRKPLDCSEPCRASMRFEKCTIRRCQLDDIRLPEHPIQETCAAAKLPTHRPVPRASHSRGMHTGSEYYYLVDRAGLRSVKIIRCDSLEKPKSSQGHRTSKNVSAFLNTILVPRTHKSLGGPLDA